MSFINIQSLNLEAGAPSVGLAARQLPDDAWVSRLASDLREWSLVIATFSPHVADAWLNLELSAFGWNRPRPETSDSTNHCCRDR